MCKIPAESQYTSHENLVFDDYCGLEFYLLVRAQSSRQNPQQMA